MLLKIELAFGKEILMVSSAMAILIIGCIIINAIYSGLAFKPSVSFLCLALMAGISEETIFRAMLIPIGMRYLKVKNRAVAAVIISSVIFGPLYLTNNFVLCDYTGGFGDASWSRMLSYQKD